MLAGLAVFERMPSNVPERTDTAAWADFDYAPLELPARGESDCSGTSLAASFFVLSECSG